MRGDMHHEAGRRSSRRGTTVVEVLIACTILAVIAVATAASLYLSRTQTMVQRNRRQALEIANGRLEALRAAVPDNIEPTLQNYSVSYVSLIGGTWHLTASDPGETVSVGGRVRPMTTTVQYMDADGGNAAYDCLRIRTSLQYREGASVQLETIRSL